MTRTPNEEESLAGRHLRTYPTGAAAYLTKLELAEMARERADLAGREVTLADVEAVSGLEPGYPPFSAVTMYLPEIAYCRCTDVYGGCSFYAECAHPETHPERRV